MYNEDDLASAIKAGVLTNDTATAFRAHVAQQKGLPKNIHEEDFRFITGFNDIFVFIACVLLLASIAWIGAAATPPVGALGVAAAAWGLAEFFTRKRRMALPSIVLLLAFVGGVFMTFAFMPGNKDGSLASASAIAAAAAWLHWLRFKVPITVAAGAIAFIGVVITLLFPTANEAAKSADILSVLAGVGVFILALRWDTADTLRQTRKADVAFWLHLLAAPLLVHPVLASLNIFGGPTSPAQAIMVVGLYIVIALVSLTIDRRALMVSALAYVLYTFSALLKQYGVVSLHFAITAMAIGSALLLLSAFWHPSRALILNCLPLFVRKNVPPFH
ncbi:hypothetical protein [Chitinimonas sp. BJB300]|uniref:hypothetical protein n=1 Tax=Chitinimonas sp. BJB300 TaxID=1559339 RepID=UPI000C10DCE9|nr:hypothetical protein [Chitinimonas sp. BJB300]PHV12905.1 hypothetical protein CSQ89_03180 [Chitinimonas sp. BJB300]TSJ88474.1 hypothetical protein FG002_009850 [Chitinimonas sp. BJB300]